MPDPIRKSRMISLRLSEAEYQALHTLYPSYGVQNVSDLARLAIHRVIANSITEAELLARVHELSDRLNIVEVQVTGLLRREKAMP